MAVRRSYPKRYPARQTQSTLQQSGRFVEMGNLRFYSEIVSNIY